MYIAEIKCLDRRKQRLTDVVRVLNLRVAKIKRSLTGDRHPAASPAERHFPASNKCMLTSYFDTILRAYDVTAALKIPKGSMLDRHDLCFQCLGNLDRVLVLSYTESVQQSVRGDGSCVKNGCTGEYG